ncbi:MAG: hypothetical protein WAL27_17515 [Cellulosimicrobium cellulans]
MNREEPVNAPGNIDSDVWVLKPSGTIAIYAANPGESVTVPIRESMTKNVRYQFILTYTVTDEQKQHAAAERGTIGKVLIDVAPSS